MKKISILLFILITAFVACKENKTTGGEKTTETKDAADPMAAHDFKLYKQAMDRADPVTAVAALNSYLLRDSSATDVYADTLIELYYGMRNVGAIYKLTGERLQKKPNDTTLLEMHISAAENVGMLSETVDECKRLVDMNNDKLEYRLYYSRALLEAGNLPEGERVLQSVADDPNATKQNINFPVYENGQLVPRAVNAKIAALMQLGQYHTQMGDKAKAETYFRSVLKIDPKFEPAAEAILTLRRSR